MDHALVLVAGTGIDGENLSRYGEKVFGGNPQIKRLLITAERAGIKKFTIIVDGNEAPLKEYINKEKRIKSEISWHHLGTPLDLDSNPYLVIQSNLITTPNALESIIESPVSENEVAVLVEESEGPLVKSNGDNKIEELFSGGGRVVGAFAADGKLLEKTLTDQAHITTLLDNATTGGELKSIKFENGYWMRMDSAGNTTEIAEDLLFENVTKSSSGWLSRNIHSKMSIPLSRLLIKTPLTPNMISGLIGFIGMLSGLFYIIGHPVVGALCLEVSTIVDRCDGEVARVKLMETKYGQWVDTIFDQLSFLSFVVGVPIGYYLLSGSPMAVILGSINTLIFLFFVVWTLYFLFRLTHSGSMTTYTKVVDDLIPVQDRTLIHKIIIKLRPMFKREFFSLVFLIAAILGGYPWVLGLTTLGLGAAFIHQVDDLIKLKRAKAI
ncbi:MAG: CDP-alcohol phosphatidyltransferase family protein [Candidatus Dadabacteria bacterium]|nr:CDP-alcohol phosphatidyltransferase family protein [Candidatus Dadabacteria bacterium]